MTSNQYPTATLRWAAVSSRDKAASDSFVYAVRTTHIYCRPNCSSRLARRSNVLFYDNPALAEAANFRACKRCKPDSRGQDDQDSMQCKIKGTVEYIRTVAENGKKTTLADLSSKTGVSKWHLLRVFRQIHGVTPNEMSEAMLQKAKWPSEMTGAMALSTSETVSRGSISNQPLPFPDLEFNVVDNLFDQFVDFQPQRTVCSTDPSSREETPLNPSPFDRLADTFPFRSHRYDSLLLPNDLSLERSPLGNGADTPDSSENPSEAALLESFLADGFFDPADVHSLNQGLGYAWPPEFSDSEMSLFGNLDGTGFSYSMSVGDNV